MVFEGDANQASKDIYADTGVLQYESVDGVEYLDQRRARPRAAHQRRRRVRARGGERAPLARRSLHDATWRPPCRGQMRSGSRARREPPDPCRCKQVIGKRRDRHEARDAALHDRGHSDDRVLGVPSTAVAGGGCHDGVTRNDATGEKTATVRMIDACFTATVTTVDPGAPVTFANTDSGSPTTSGATSGATSKT